MNQPLIGRQGGPTLTVGRPVGTAWLFAGAGMVICGAVDLTDAGDDAVPMALTGAFVMVLGVLTYRFGREPRHSLTREVMLNVTSSALALIAASTLLYLVAGATDRIDDALYESVAGMTTTASTIFEAPESLGRGVSLWRAVTQWLGGLSMIVIALAVFPRVRLGSALTGGGRVEGLTGSVRDLAKSVVVVFSGATFALFVGYLLAGLGAFDSVFHAMTTISTGGFSTRGGSMAAFDSAPVEWVAIGGMLLGGANVALVVWAARGQRTPAYQALELKLYLGFIALATGAILVSNSSTSSLRSALFTSASTVSTTGYRVEDWSRWQPGVVMLLIVLTAIGAMNDSCGGGFRVSRVAVLLKLARVGVKRELHPRLVSVVKVAGRPVDPDLKDRISGHVFLTAAVVLFGAIGLGLAGVDFLVAVSGAVSAFSTAGPIVGLDGAVSSFANASAFSAPARGVLMVLMIVGRLSIYPLLVCLGIGLRAVRDIRVTRRIRLRLIERRAAWKG